MLSRLKGAAYCPLFILEGLCFEFMSFLLVFNLANFELVILPFEVFTPFTQPRVFDFSTTPYYNIKAFRCSLKTGQEGWVVSEQVIKSSYGGFDPGSGLTLAACLSHASRAGLWGNPQVSGGRRSNT